MNILNCNQSSNNQIMKYFIAKLIFNINIDNGVNQAQFDEQTRLIQASDIEGAFLKARVIGNQEEETFVNANNEMVHWKFIDVMAVYALSDMKDGEQIYSSTHEKEDANNFIKFVKEKSMLIQAKHLSFV